MCKRVCQEIIKSVPKLPGVYLIEHILTNRIYIGFSKNISNGAQHRISQHFDDMQNGKESNVLLQDVWNYDPVPSHWRAELLEETTDWSRERHYMNAFSIPNDHDFNKNVCMKGILS